MGAEFELSGYAATTPDSLTFSESNSLLLEVSYFLLLLGTTVTEIYGNGLREGKGLLSGLFIYDLTTGRGLTIEG